MSVLTFSTIAGIVLLSFLVGTTLGMLLCAMMTVAKGDCDG